MHAQLPQVVAKINAATNNALQMPDVRTKLMALGAEIAGGTPEAFGTFLKNELTKWKQVAVE